MSTQSSQNYRPQGKPKYYDKTKKMKYDNKSTTKKVDMYQDKKLKQLEKKVTALENTPEIKYVLSTAEGTLNTSAPVILIGPLIENGSDVDERIGNRITSKWVEYRLRLAIPSEPTVPNKTFSFRWIVVWDLETNGNVLDTAFLNTTTTPGPERLANAVLDDRSGETLMSAPFYYENRHRFKVLQDKMIQCRLNYAEEEPILYFNKTIPLHNAIIDYSVAPLTPEGDFLIKRSLRTFLISQDNGNAVYALFERFFYTDV